jgi:hypothetical protein
MAGDDDLVDVLVPLDAARTHFNRATMTRRQARRMAKPRLGFGEMARRKRAAAAGKGG